MMKSAICILALSLGMAMAQQTNPPAATQPTTRAAKTGTPTEMKTLTYKGVLIDTSCTAPTASGQPAPSEGTAQASTPAGSANRTQGDCAVSANSTQLGMKLNDGRTLRFDLVGNQRAQDELKNNKRWSKDLGAGKPIHATVSGVITGEKLVVSSIH